MKWGGQFEVPLRSNNVRYDCTLPDGRPVCCAAVLSNSTYTEDALKLSRGVGYSYSAERPIKTAAEKSKTRCVMMEHLNPNVNLNLNAPVIINRTVTLGASRRRPM